MKNTIIGVDLAKDVIQEPFAKLWEPVHLSSLSG